MTHHIAKLPATGAAGWLRHVLALCLVVLLAVPAFAQDAAKTPNYDEWTRVADSAAATLEQGALPTLRLNEMRDRLVEWRATFETQRNINGPQIEALQKQIDALGPAPTEGQTESAEISARRAELTAQMDTLTAPRARAAEAYSQADTLVSQIDATLRARQNSALRQVSPSPLNPVNWATAIGDATRLANGANGDVVFAVKNLSKRDMSVRGPRGAAYLVVALLLLTLGRMWVASLPDRMSARAPAHARDAVNFVVSLTQIIIPVVGVQLLVLALRAFGLDGPWIGPLLDTLPPAFLALIGGLWLARRLMPPGVTQHPTLPIPEIPSTRARYAASLLSLAYALHMLQVQLGLPLSGFGRDVSDPARVPMYFQEGTAAVWHFPINVIGAFFLFSLCHVLRRLPRMDSDESSLFVRMLAYVGSAGRIVAVVSVAMGAFGFINGSNALLWSSVLTLALIGLMVLLHEFILDVYQTITRKPDETHAGLAPVIVAALLMIAAVPSLALIWGSSVNDLIEFWNKARQGIAIGGLTLSPGVIISLIVVFSIGYALTRILQGSLRKSILPRTKMDKGAQNALVSGVGYLGIFLATVIAITSTGLDLSSLAIFASALSVGIGFGLQTIVQNFVSGIILLVERPVAVGDWVRVGQNEGIVQQISVRSTRIQTFDRTDVILPNSDLITQPVTNWTRGKLTGRISVPVTVAYGSDTRKVVDVLRRIAEDQPTVLIDPPPSILFMGFSSNGLEFEIRAILADINGGLGVRTEMRHQIIERFAAEGIDIPFAQHEVSIRNPEQFLAALKEMAQAQASDGANAAETDTGPKDQATSQPRTV